jgi:hypothetical protein
MASFRDMPCGTVCALAVALSAAPAMAQQIDHAHVAASALEADPTIAFDPTSVLVRFAPRADEAAIAKALASVDGWVIRRFTIVPGLAHIAIGVPVEAALATLAKSGAIEYAEPDFVVRTQEALPNDEKFNMLWAMHNIGQTVNGDVGTHGADLRGPRAWSMCIGEPDELIAVIDTGTLVDHPDLAANIWVNPGEIEGNGIDDDGNGYIDDVHGWDFFGDDNDPSDPGHGTHTAGTIGAVGNNGIGVVGVSWECRMMPIRFIGPLGGFISGAIASIEYALGHSVRISNNSWGGTTFSHALYESMAAACDRDHLAIAAAGNLARNTDVQPFFPASFNLPNIVSVAAVDNDDDFAAFSNYGPTTVDLAAPGVTIFSTDGSDYGFRNGTSMACAHVTGLAAMLVVDFPGWTCVQVKDRLLETVRPVDAMQGRCVTGGVLDAAAALDIEPPPADTAPTVEILAPSSGSVFDAGQSVAFTAQAEDAEDGTLSPLVVWTSSLQGLLGTGELLVATELELGKHTITASITDSGGNIVRAHRSIVVVAIEVPAAPATARVTHESDGARIAWIDRSYNETGFEIRRERRVNGQWGEATIAGSVPRDFETFVDAALPAGTYRFAVRAIRGSARSEWSRWASITVR